MSVQLHIVLPDEFGGHAHPMKFRDSMIVGDALEEICGTLRIHDADDWVLCKEESRGRARPLDEDAMLASYSLRDTDALFLRRRPGQIRVVLPSGALEVMDVDMDVPVANAVAAIIRNVYGKSRGASRFSLVFENQELHPDYSLLEHEIPPNATVQLVPPPEHSDDPDTSDQASTSSQSFSAIKNFDKAGSLNKYQKATKRWQRRWFVLKDDVLYIFKSQQDPKPKTTIVLRRYTVRDAPEARKDKHAFEIEAEGDKGDRILLILSAASEYERRDWVDVLKKRSDHYGPLGKRWFGVPLDEALRKNGAGRVPVVVMKAIAFLDEHLEEEGLLRLAGSQKAIVDLKEAFDIGEDVDLHARVKDPHVVASLLKQYFRELPEPLLTFSLLDDFVATQNEPTREVRLEMMRSLVNQLPPANRETLRVLCAFMIRVAEHKEFNKMTLTNLCTLLGPNLLRRVNETSEQMVLDAQAVHGIMTSFVNEYPFFFEGMEFSGGATMDDGEPVLGYARAMYDFYANNVDELSIKKNQIITVKMMDDDGWWFGELNGKCGVFPGNYVAFTQHMPRSSSQQGMHQEYRPETTVVEARQNPRAQDSQRRSGGKFEAVNPQAASPVHDTTWDRPEPSYSPYSPYPQHEQESAPQSRKATSPIQSGPKNSWGHLGVEVVNSPALSEPRGQARSLSPTSYERTSWDDQHMDAPQANREHLLRNAKGGSPDPYAFGLEEPEAVSPPTQSKAPDGRERVRPRGLSHSPANTTSGSVYPSFPRRIRAWDSRFDHFASQFDPEDMDRFPELLELRWLHDRLSEALEMTLRSHELDLLVEVVENLELFKARLDTDALFFLWPKDVKTQFVDGLLALHKIFDSFGKRVDIDKPRAKLREISSILGVEKLIVSQAQTKKKKGGRSLLKRRG